MFNKTNQADDLGSEFHRLAGWCAERTSVRLIGAGEPTAPITPLVSGDTNQEMARSSRDDALLSGMIETHETVPAGSADGPFSSKKERDKTPQKMT